MSTSFLLFKASISFVSHSFPYSLLHFNPLPCSIDRKIYRHMHLIIGKYASHDKSHDALIRLFIDGLIVPALCDPKSYGLLNGMTLRDSDRRRERGKNIKQTTNIQLDDPKPRIHKGLTHVAKILQNAGYGTPFPANHVYAFANNFIQKHSQTLQDFVDSLAVCHSLPLPLPSPPLFSPLLSSPLTSPSPPSSLPLLLPTYLFSATSKTSRDATPTSPN